MIASRYSLRDEVGRGGMGVVWRAEDEVLGREVALKRIGLMPGGATPDVARAAREARLAASLNHPNVVAVFDLAEQDDEQWLVMEYVESRTLDQLVKERGKLSPDTAAELLSQAADALAAAHRARIVHRDVKPSNILVTAEGQVKLTDFGIARAHADATLTKTGMMTGSPAYLSPEVASGQPATPASDVWALGATLYHALTGRPPYDAGSNVMGTLYKVVHEEPPRTKKAGWLAPLLEATMAKDPADRWSMDRVAEFLARGPAVEPTLAAPSPADATTILPTPQPPTGDRSHRLRRLTAAAWVGVALALVAALVVGWMLLDPGSGERPDSGGDAGTPTASDQPSKQPSAATERGMKQFVADYLSTAAADPAAGYDMLTPEFQRASGGLSGYQSWWDRVDSATPTSVSADPAAKSVTYTVSYDMTDGGEFTDTVTLTLEGTDGSYLIASEPSQ